MSDKKLSQLPVGTAVQDADLFYCAQSLGGGLYTQVQQPMTAIGTYLLAASTSTGDPTANIGLTVINGVATTAMRSDAAPALSQTIVPTWSGLHTFNGGIAGIGGFSVDTSGNVTAKKIYGSQNQTSVTSSPISVNPSDQIINCNITAGSPTCTLPQASGRAGVALTFKDIGGQFTAHPLTITPFAGDTIDGLASVTLSNNYAGITLIPITAGAVAGWMVE